MIIYIKIGEGTLIVNASGINEGGLKVGNGVTVLNQQPDAYGRKWLLVQ